MRVCGDQDGAISAHPLTGGLTKSACICGWVVNVIGAMAVMVEYNIITMEIAAHIVALSILHACL